MLTRTVSRQAFGTQIRRRVVQSRSARVVLARSFAESSPSEVEAQPAVASASTKPQVKVPSPPYLGPYRSLSAGEDLNLQLDSGKHYHYLHSRACISEIVDARRKKFYVLVGVHENEDISCEQVLEVINKMKPGVVMVDCDPKQINKVKKTSQVIESALRGASNMKSLVVLGGQDRAVSRATLLRNILKPRVALSVWRHLFGDVRADYKAELRKDKEKAEAKKRQEEEEKKTGVKKDQKSEQEDESEDDPIKQLANRVHVDLASEKFEQTCPELHKILYADRESHLAQMLMLAPSPKTVAVVDASNLLGLERRLMGLIDSEQVFIHDRSPLTSTSFDRVLRYRTSAEPVDSATSVESIPSVELVHLSSTNNRVIHPTSTNNA